MNLVVNTLTARYGKGTDSDAGDPMIVSALTANGVGTCGADDNQAQAGHIVSPTLTACGGPEGGRTDKIPITTFQKIVRSGERDPEGNLPPEVWAQRDVAATLNLNDLSSASRAVDLVVSATGETAHTLTSEGHDASEDGTGRGTPIIAETLRSHPRPGSNSVGALAFHMTQDPISGDVVPAMGRKSGGNGVLTETVVRRLTPRECERLQGFPDDWTATSNGKPQADSARYRQMGNAVAVPCVEWIARRVVAA